MWPGVRAVEDVNWGGRDFTRLHYLDVHSPRRVVPILNRVEEALDVIIRLRSGQSDSLVGIHRLNAIVRLKVPFDINIASILDNLLETVL